jgi:outer membrane protein OmpA-like peptidoglycan-associated protein
MRTTSARSIPYQISRKSRLAVSLALLLGIGACTTNPYTGEKEASKAGMGAGIGAVAGGLVGAIAGDNRNAILLGMGVGALAGGGAGYYMDKQEDKLRAQLQSTGVSVTRNADKIILNMPGNITFASNSSNISADFYQVLDSVALVINEFEKTYVDVYGYTDSTGSAAYNQTLSKARTSSVASYLISQKVTPQRVVTRGMGESQPIASNDTPEGRTLNRRVEIVLIPIT